MTTRTRAPSSPSGRPAAGSRRGRHRRSGLSRRSRRRLFALLVGFGLAFLLVGAKLVSIQGLNSARYTDYGDKQSVSVVALPALRGSILASNGDELALSEMRDTIFADPDEVTDAAAEAARLAPILHQRASTLAKEMTARTTYVALETGAGDPLGDAVTKLDLAGIGVDQQPERFYPAGALAAPVIGALNDNGAVSGLELGYDKVLTGKPGKLAESVDPSGLAVPGSVTEDVPAVDGGDIVTTINEALQYQTEQALSKAIVSADGTGGTAIVEDTQTGALLAVANLVSNGDGSAPVEAPSASAFTLVYEPGSVAKIVTISGALAKGVISPDQTFTIPESVDGEHVGYLVNGTYFHDAENHPTELLTLTGILAQSSNIGAIEVAQQLGPANLYHYEEAFGLTRKTDIDFPGQSAGIVTPLARFNGTTLPTLAFGENDAVTAVQMISAMNTVADGGLYVPPRLVTATVGPTGKEAAVPAPKPHRVVPASVAHEVTGMLEQVVSNGTGVAAKVSSYAVAGKTGTAYALKTEGGGYDKNRYVSSFAGFAPAQDPKVTVMVVVDHTADYGAEASAPAFSTITRDALLDLGIAPDGAQPAPSYAALPVIDGEVDLALMQ